MNLSFSIRGWQSYGWADYLTLAEELGFSGIALYDGMDPALFDREGPFHKYSIGATVRELAEKNIRPVNLALDLDLSDENADANAAAIKEKLAFAASLRMPYISVHASGDRENAGENVLRCLAQTVDAAEEKGVAILLETRGLFCNTALLRETLESFASDALCALWAVHEPMFLANESTEDTIKNLGAYIRHVELTDSEDDGEGRRFCLIGEGDLPLRDVMRALSSVNYDGFLSLHWEPQWMPDLPEMDIILSHFENYLSAFETPSRQKHHLYLNRAETGRYVWKKDALIEKTFSQVLDKMVEEFPDQYAFKYTTLDYTRTYEQFRDDVDECARALLAVGVKPGAKVAIWATNIPQWYITFWATTKIGAILVTVNTAYKIHEAEYLFKQSDTHTVVLVEGFRDSNYSKIMAELCPELETTVPGKPLHAKRLPFLRNVVTVGFRQKGCLTWEELLERADNVPK
ncbi:MAG: AMP-binding protein, partial [Clostridia bacterium]|nr:AMP-binding protein [Clostridia bacterium]